MRRLPAGFEPQLASLVKAPPEGDAWLHELKYDGYRIGCRIDGDDVRLFSRRGKEWTDSFPEVRDAVRALKVKRALLDGEVAIVLPDGKTSFQALQNSFSGGTRGGLTYFLFDLLHIDGDDLALRPLDERKARLQKLLGKRDRSILRYSDHVIGSGKAFFGQACKAGLEGIVSKQRALPYQPGRNAGWVKSKCIKRQEFVIGGFTDPEGSRQGLGALLVGTYEGSKLRFAGKVGTGFTHKSVVELRRRLDPLEQKNCPFDSRPPFKAHWVNPVLVAEVAYGERTDDGMVRHSSFQGLREDKPANEVVPEVALTHPERVLYPEAGITKLDLARYYESIADWILPHVKGRPLTLVRCPDGLAKDCFYMKHSGVWAPPALKRVPIKEKTKTGTYLIIENLPGIISLVQMSVLEIHTWNSTMADVEKPDRIVFDLDPGPAVKFAQVIAGAQLLRQALNTLGLESFVKNTGSKGLHVVVPLAPVHDHADCLAFSRQLATTIARHDPKQYTVAMPKLGREKKILIDYLRNNRGSTSVAAFSARARPQAPVSVPLAWDELSPDLPSDHFTVKTLPERLARLRRNPWARFWACHQRLPL